MKKLLTILVLTGFIACATLPTYGKGPADDGHASDTGKANGGEKATGKGKDGGGRDNSGRANAPGHNKGEGDTVPPGGEL